LQKAGAAFQQGAGPLIDVAKGVWGEVTGNQPAIEQGKQALGNIVTGIGPALVKEPARIGGEMVQAAQAIGQGNLQEAAHHVVGATPLVGPAMQQVGQDVQRGDPAAAWGHTGALAAQLLGPKILEGVGPAVEATGEAAQTAGTFMRGATVPALKAVVQRPPYGAALIGQILGGPKGAAIAATIAKIPGVIKAGVEGGRAALDADAAAVAERAAAQVRATTAARAAADAAMRQHVGTFETFERMTQPPPLALPAPESIQMPPAGTYAEEQRIQALGPEPSTPAPTEATPTPAQPTPEATPAVTPGQTYAKAQGYDWGKLRPSDRALLENIARAHANVAAQPEPVASPAPAAAPPTAPIAEQPPAAPLTPQEIAQNLKAEMERSGTAAPPETAPPPEAKPTPEEVARARKTDALFDFITSKKIPMSWVNEFEDKEWKMVADAAGVNSPSETSIGQLKQRLADYEKAQNIPLTPATTPAEAQTAFEQARTARIPPAK
jgi:hypothetical protein